MTMYKKFSILVWTAALIVSASVSSFAASYDIKQMTPEIKRAIENRQGRYEELQRLKNAGEVGENHQGYAEVLKGSGASDLVRAENADRKLIYQAIVDQNGLGRGGLPQVEQAFAEIRRDKAGSGEYFQDHKGNWLQKF